jgi:hypothetical protein
MSRPEKAEPIGFLGLRYAEVTVTVSAIVLLSARPQ